MTIRHKVTHQEIKGDFRQSMGWWQCDGPGLLSVSYPMSEWEEVTDSAESQWVPVEEDGNENGA